MSTRAIETVEFPAITREQLTAYADASGDRNLIHLDDEVARRAGLPGVIAHGMLSAAQCVERAEKFVREELGLKAAALLEVQTRFKAMVFPGDSLRIGGVFKQEERLTLELQAKNGKGEITVFATVVYVDGSS